MPRDLFCYRNRWSSWRTWSSCPRMQVRDRLEFPGSTGAGIEPHGVLAAAAARQRSRPHRRGRSSTDSHPDLPSLSGSVGGTFRTSERIAVLNRAGPWSKTGGLGDVVGSLPIALSRRGHRVMVVTPR